MALFELKNRESTQLDHLRDYHTFGRRKDTVDTLIEHSYVSKLHAVIEWRAPNWLLKDVSKNGIKLNGKILPAQKSISLEANDIIDFSGKGEAIVTIKDLSPPKPVLINITSPSTTIDLTHSILIPADNTPEVALYFCPDREHWFAESLKDGEEHGPYESGDLITLMDAQWKFLLISNDDATKEFSPNQTDLSDITFRFDLSQDEECTELTLIHDEIELDLGERSHHYLMVHLLRHRLQTDNSAGWLDTQLIMKELGLEESHLNIQIFRARKQVAAAFSSATGHSKLIERRRGALRVGISNFEIYKEGIQEA